MMTKHHGLSASNHQPNERAVHTRRKIRGDNVDDAAWVMTRGEQQVHRHDEDPYHQPTCHRTYRARRDPIERKSSHATCPRIDMLAYHRPAHVAKNDTPKAGWGMRTVPREFAERLKHLVFVLTPERLRVQPH